MTGHPGKPKPKTPAEARAERLAAELRANLKRRKDKARAAEPDPETGAAPPTPGQKPGR